LTLDAYAGAGRGWARGASLVYRPIATEMVAMTPHALAGRTVLDAGAGTGAASLALLAHGARPVATDLSLDMLAHDAPRRPSCVVADICALPFAGGSVDDVVAAFVLNHLVRPAVGFAELVRVTKPGGAALATVFGTANRSDSRDEVDEEARMAGWQAPDWYADMKANAVPVLGSEAAMRAAARAAGLTEIDVTERPVDVGVTEPEQLVSYRFGQAHFASWLASLGPDRAAEVRRRAAEAIRPIMEPYRPIVVFLSATVPASEWPLP